MSKQVTLPSIGIKVPRGREMNSHLRVHSGNGHQRISHAANLAHVKQPSAVGRDCLHSIVDIKMHIQY